MKTIITSVKGPPLRRVLCSLLFGAAAFCVVPTNIQAQAPPDIVWVTTGNSIAAYNANGTALNGFNVITLQPKPLYGFAFGPAAHYPLALLPHLGGILVSGANLYVAAEWVPNISPLQVYSFHTQWHDDYAIAAYNAETGTGISSPLSLSRQTLGGWSYFGPAGMALSAPYPVGPSGGPYLYVANYNVSSITRGSNLLFIQYTVRQNPYALAVYGNELYVTNNAQNSNSDYYISTYYADSGKIMNANFINISTGGLYGLALKNITTLGEVLYVSVYSGGASAPGVYTYNALTGQPINLTGQPIQRIQGLFVLVNEPRGIAIGSPPVPGGNPTLYVASQQNSMIYEFDATNGAKLSGSIGVSSPINITVYPATQQ
jgi:hypothetical protein